MDIKLHTLPMADGGEDSNAVLSAKFKCKKIKVEDVIEPIGNPAESYYLKLDKYTAFIGSAQILGLPPELDRYKNPLVLTSYGLGQLIKDAINRKFKKIIIGLGGTSTVDGGIGMAQALGARFLNSKNLPLIPGNNRCLTGSDLSEVMDVELGSIPSCYKDLSVIGLCDTTINVTQMHIPTNRKISKHCDKERTSINKTLEVSLLQYCRIVSRKLSSGSNLKHREGFGVAGGINLSLVLVFELTTVSGIMFFMQKLGLEEVIKNSDLVITGEGRFENEISLKGKTPFGVLSLAKKYSKPVLFICGDVCSSLKRYFKSYLASGLPDEIKDYGITDIISFHKYYEGIRKPSSYKKEVELYRRSTPQILKEALRLYSRNNWERRL